MPRKGGNGVTRPNQPSSSVPVHMRSQLARSSSVQRKPASVSFQKQEREEDEIEVDELEEIVAGDDEVEDDNVAEMLTILQEFQKRKATKSSARSAAFQNEKGALFTEARNRAEFAVKDGLASIEKARVTVTELRAKEVSQDMTLDKLKVLRDSQDDCVQSVLRHLTGVIEDLSHRRAAQIDEASAALEGQAELRAKSRRRLVSSANARMADNMENQKVVSDASALIKHYKALLLW